MKKLWEYGRKAMFYVRVLSGYEERRIRSYRLQFQNRIQQAEAKKAAMRKVPEQIILSEVRQMVDEMKALNKKLEDTETAIEDYFKPIDKEAEMIMKIQLDGEEKRARDMVKTMQAQALLEETEAERIQQLKAAAEAERITKLNATAQDETNLKPKTIESNEKIHEKVPLPVTTATAASS